MPQFWTKDQDKILMDLKKKGLNHVEVGREMGFTSDQVGHRIRTLRGKGVKVVAGSYNQKSTIQWKSKKSAPRIIPTVSGTTEEIAVGIKISEKKLNSCMYPLVMDKENTTYCGEPTHKLRSSWCAKHAKIATVSPMSYKQIAKSSGMVAGKPYGLSKR